MVTRPEAVKWFVNFTPMLKILLETLVVSQNPEDFALICEFLTTLAFAAVHFEQIKRHFLVEAWDVFLVDLIKEGDFDVF